MKKKTILIIVILLIIAGILWAFKAKNTVKYELASLARKTIVETVEASGTINPVKTVNIGSQVSGMIKDIYVDFNSKVKKGELLAQIDPSIFEAQVNQAQGNLAAAQANYAKAQSMLIHNRQNYERYEKLYTRNYVAKSEVDLAKATYESDLAQLNAMSAQIRSATATLENNMTNLKYTKIISPVDGVVISRNVDVGQTVAASFQTPTLFMVAQDLTQMQIEVNVSEADIGRIKVGQEVDYNLDGYGDKIFKGEVSQVRISPTTISNVVTYTVVVTVDNEEDILKPGMTANVSIIVNKKEDVLCTPNEALRFVPKSSGKAPKVRQKEQGVWVLQNGTPVRIEIKTGMRDNDMTEIISDELNENSRIITGIQGQKGKRPQQMQMRLF